MPVERSAGAIIFRKERDKPFLLLLHYPSSSRATAKGREEDLSSSNSRTKKDYWDLPKGHIEKGEDEISTIKREVEEETGLKDINFIEGFKETIKYFFKFQGKTIFKTVCFYLVETKDKEVKISREHIGFKWLPYKEALDQLTFKNAKEILKKANKFLSRESV